MEPINLILNALTEGAVASVGNTASQAIKDCYDCLKKLIKDKFFKKEDAEDADKLLTRYESDPDTYEKPLRKELSQLKIDQDQKLLQTAQQLMKLVGQQKENLLVSQTINAGSIGNQINVANSRVDGGINIGNK